ncbi:MAG: metallophosphoesterase [Candidatus Pacebacteria bacterium]|nr:metallophosphoesterase [Candidatus Paceibacterota bacterium]
MNILFVIVALVASAVIFGLPIWNLARLKNNKHPLWIITPAVIFISSFGLARILEQPDTIGFFKFFNQLSFYWLVFGLALFGFSILGLFIQKVFTISHVKTFWGILGSTIIFFVITIVNGQHIIVKDLNLEADHISREYQFVQISDIQHGITNTSYMQRMIDKIAKVDPEFVVITGDFIDEFYVTREDINIFNQLTMPIYLITGNHEYYLPAGTLEDVISETDIQLIDRTRIQYDELDIIGINELETIDGTLDNLGGINQERYTIILDHQPITEEVKRAAARGAELMLSGHTHNGQIWPMGLLVSLEYPFVNGLYTVSDMFLYVTQGTGTVGPLMRFGTSNEITHIHLKPTQ